MSAPDWFKVTGKPNDGRPVHMARRHPTTDRIGCWSTPRDLTRTACAQTWDAGHVTLTIALVSCDACRRWCNANPHSFHAGVYERTRDGGRPFTW